jgi:SAM-dependent methyltransferase
VTSRTINFYNRQSSGLQAQYLSTSAEDVHKSWLADYLPVTGIVLDLGAGVGRDARYFAEQGLEVIAVEPAQEFLKLGQEYTKDDSVQWLSDKLPELSKVCALQLKFDLVLLSAVWMHIPTSQRNRAFRKIANLLKPNGVLVISLRHGASTDEREMFGVSVSELTQLSRNYGLSVVNTQAAEDTLDRKEVRWETVVMRLPDDASSSFPVIRNILINDAKSSTYKLALLRTLLRIADGHPGAVLHRDDESVILPLGLVSLYWARQYKLLLDAGIQQNSNPNKGLGFI